MAVLEDLGGKGGVKMAVLVELAVQEGSAVSVPVAVLAVEFEDWAPVAVVAAGDKDAGWALEAALAKSRISR